LRNGNAKQAFVELSAAQDKLVGNIEFDYLLGVAALDTGRNEDAIIAFERVLILNPSHAGAQLDLARAYFQTGAFDLSETGFLKLRDSKPPADALTVINRYLDAIEKLKRRNTPSFSRYIELGLGHDSNITGVPVDFTGAVFNAFALPGIQATGNSIKRSAAYFNAQGGGEYNRPVSRGYAWFIGADARGRWYNKLPDFRIAQGDARLGVSYTGGDAQGRLSLGYQAYKQDGAAPFAPGEQRAANDRNQVTVNGDWRLRFNQRNQFIGGLQYSQIRFPSNRFEDFNQLLASVGWAHSFDRKGSPLLYLSAYAANDKALRQLPDQQSDKSKRVWGLRGYVQYAVAPTVNIFTQLGVSERKDQSDFARALTVVRGKDRLADASLGVLWKFQERCNLRAGYTHSRNSSNIAIFEFKRNEWFSNIRCEG
jgi:outer membrane protein